jgi:solute carrier family 25 phosphate transporter 3
MTTQFSMTDIGAAGAASSFEIPLVATSAASSGVLCCFLLAPFDAVRIRTVSQPDFADNILDVVKKIIKEEGFFSLFSALNAWFLKEVPYNIVKFLVFDSFTACAYNNYPVAQEDIRLSLLVSLIGGTCGGIAASVVSNPADVIVTEMKKSKSDMSPLEAANSLRQRAGLKAFTYGLPLRMIFYSLLVSLQFLLYDTVRIALGVGQDDMKLYLNVLGAALKEVSDA